MRRKFTAKTKALAFQRANGRCEECGARLTVGKYHYDHIIPDALTGAAILSNCAVICIQCHNSKSRTDVSRIAKAKRMQARHIGAKRSPYRPIQSAGFASREKRPKPLTKVMARRQIYTDSIESQYVEEGHDVV